VKTVDGTKEVKKPAVRATLIATAFVFTALAFFTSLLYASASQKTARDKVYSKEQAARGADVYVKYCEKCHDPDKLPEGKKPPPPVMGEKFRDTWQDRTLGELYTLILTTMPSDASTVLTPDQTLDVMAHLLKANQYPEGTAPLKNDDAMKAIVIVK
jgi:cytochrome c5